MICMFSLSENNKDCACYSIAIHYSINHNVWNCDYILQEFISQCIHGRVSKRHSEVKQTRRIVSFFFLIIKSFSIFIAVTISIVKSLWQFFSGALPTTSSKVQFQKGYLPYPTSKNCEPNKLISLRLSIKPFKSTYILSISIYLCVCVCIYRERD